MTAIDKVIAKPGDGGGSHSGRRGESIPADAAAENLAVKGGTASDKMIAANSAWFQLFVSKPLIQFALLGVVVGIHFAPLWPRLASFIQGVLVAIFLIIIVAALKISTFLRPRDVLDEETADSSVDYYDFYPYKDGIHESVRDESAGWDGVKG